MAEQSAAIAAFQESEIVLEFRQALLGVYPSLVKMECLKNDTQPYDDFDDVAECLWDVIVLRGFMWKYGLDQKPELPAYGFHGTEVRLGEYLEASFQNCKCQFIQFVGWREFGTEPFNAAEGVDASGTSVRFPVETGLSFKWIRTSGE